MLCDLGADFDLADNLGNTPLHYASAWGHVPIVQYLIERGCQYTAKNNEGFDALDYAYSFSTKEALQETARMQFEINKAHRRQIFAQAAARGTEMNKTSPIPIPPPVPAKDYDLYPRLRSGSGTSRTTATTSDSGDIDGLAAHASFSSSSPSRPSTGGSSSLLYSQQPRHTPQPSSASNGLSNSTNSKGSLLSAPGAHPSSALSPVANRMRERDADAMEKYMLRNRSGSSSTDNRSNSGSTTTGSGQMSANLSPSSEAFHITTDEASGTLTPRRLRPSFSAAQLRTTHEGSVANSNNGTPHSENRSRSGTNPTSTRGAASPLPLLTRSPSISNSLRSIISPERTSYEDSKRYMGPPSQYAQFPEPPVQPEANTVTTPTVQSSRRKALQILGKPLSGFDSSNSNHRRGMSTTSVRGS
ncbi:hypothetical protein CC2G_010424 [Coprinopsis cinerea AmutBmut pab1-1]|nr:hypothetical protein CC2G_010424 [Coprinopsis cinerea AmutBmut pab1-1]